MQQASIQETAAKRVPEARYAYYRRCRVFRKNGEQCKAPAEKGAHICHAHAGQLATAVRRERERRAVLEEAVAEMRRRGKPEFEMADLFMDFKGIQVTIAVMARALIDGRIDCKTAGRLAVQLQMMSKLLWMMRGKGKTLPRINTDDTDRKELRAKNNPAANQRERTRIGLVAEKGKTLPRINTDDTDRKEPKAKNDEAANACERTRIALVAEIRAFPDDGGYRHGPQERDGPQEWARAA